MKSKPFIGTRSEVTSREIYSRVKEEDKMQNGVPTASYIAAVEAEMRLKCLYPP